MREISIQRWLELIYLMDAGIIGFEADRRREYQQWEEVVNLQKIVKSIVSKQSGKIPNFKKFAPELNALSVDEPDDWSHDPLGNLAD